jgi:ketosteroid isomerase-like protein
VSPRQTVEAWIEAFNRADAAAVSALYAEDAVNHQVMWEPLVGKAAIRAMFERESGHDGLYPREPFRGRRLGDP